MSKFSSDLMQYMTAYEKQKVAFLNPLLSIEDEVSEIRLPYLESAYEYRIEIKLGRHVVAKSSKELQFLKKRVAEEIIHHIFGEFKSELYDLDILIRRGEREKASAKVTHIMERMFNVQTDVSTT